MSFRNRICPQRYIFLSTSANPLLTHSRAGTERPEIAIKLLVFKSIASEIDLRNSSLEKVTRIRLNVITNSIRLFERDELRREIDMLNKRFCSTLHRSAIVTLLLTVIAALPANAEHSYRVLYTTLYSFCSQTDCSDGSDPLATLIQASDGNLYGTTDTGGANYYGTVFKISLSGTLTTLYNFCSQSYCADGGYPHAGLIQATDGNFYGEALTGGANRYYGTVFKITPSGTLTTLYSFSGPDGAEPDGGLIQASDGSFYGTTAAGGTKTCLFGYSCGTVFKITPSGTLTTLYNFSGPDGEEPYGGLIQATDGNFYGTTFAGGTVDAGTVFKITPSGTLTTLYSFCSLPNCNDGGFPHAGLIQARNGDLYGTTFTGGANNDGTVFKITPSGRLTTLHAFDGNDGGEPTDVLIQASDGNFYGTAVAGGAKGGASGLGTVFKITPRGRLTTLHTFDGSDGSNPWAGLVQASDGNFYGTTYVGGANDDGTVFRLALARK